MTQDNIMKIFNDAIWLAFRLAMPVLIVAMVVGLVIAILQAATQVHEQTVTFAPKAVAVTLTLLATGPWMMNSVADFMREIFDMMANVPLR